MKELLDNYHNLSEEKKKLLKILLKEQGIDIDTKVILPRERTKGLYPLSYSQQRLWFLEHLEPNSALYIIPSGVKIVGDIKNDFLLHGLKLITERHEVLRTRFVEKDGEGYQEILDQVAIEPIYYDLSVETNNNSLALDEIIDEQFRKPFKLSECPLFRVVFIKAADNITYLLLPMHHIVSDNWSTGLLIKELLECYKSFEGDENPDLPKLDIQYLDYALWQREYLKSDDIKKQQDYWIKNLQNSNNVLEIIPDKKRPTQQTYNGSFILFKIGPELTSKTELLAKSENLTVFIIFLAVYQFILSKYSLQDDINIGVPIANRNRTEIEELIGFFINTLVFRGKINLDKTVKEFLSDTKKLSLATYANQDIPFEMIVDSLNLERDMSHTALFQAMLVVNNAPVPSLELEGLKFEPLDIDTGKTKFDLVLSFTKTGKEYSGKFEYNNDLYEQSTINSLTKYFISALNQFTGGQDKELSSISLSDEKNIISEMVKAKSIQNNMTTPEILHNNFEKVAEKYPNKIAVTDGDKSWTYNELNEISNILAEKLISSGIEKENSVGIYLDRRIEYISAIIAILKIGGVYVPLDLDYPESRLEYIINDSAIKSVITSEKISDQLPDYDISILNIEQIDFNQKSVKNPSIKIYPENAAYIIYTSGSTGLPKGVVVEHSAISSHIQSMIDEFGIESNDKYLAFATFNFDASIEQLFVPLLAGAEIFLRGNDYWMPSDFIKLIGENGITVINPPTVYWNQFVSEIVKNVKSDLGKLRLVISGGAEMRTEMLSAWNENISQKIRLINAYGPTETIITSAIFNAKEKDIRSDHLHTPIGRTTGNRNVYIIDLKGNPVPPNVPGELCFSSNLLARGYLNNAALTAEKFIPDNFSNVMGRRLYKTGDLARYSGDGLIEYLGRVDDQVKIRGYRIELGEIEEVLIGHPEVNETAVTVNSLNSDSESLIAFIVTENKTVNTEEDVLKFCRKKLPEYMLPSKIILIDSLPLTVNGKIDKNKLLTSTNLTSSSNMEYIAPRSDLESEIAGIVSEILRTDRVGIKDNFFQLGGHSILAIKVVSKIREIFGVELQLKKLFENPTVEGLSEAVLLEQSKLVDEDELESLLEQIEKL